MTTAETEPQEHEQILQYVSRFADDVITSSGDETLRRTAYNKYLFGVVMYAMDTHLEPSPWIASREQSPTAWNSLHDEQLAAALIRHNATESVLRGIYPAAYTVADWRTNIRRLAASIGDPQGKNLPGAVSTLELLEALTNGSAVFREMRAVRP